MKKVIAMTLAAILVVTLFAGCAVFKKGGSNALVGKWVWEYEGLGEVMSFTFNADGTGTMDALGDAVGFTYSANSTEIEMTLEGETDTVPYKIDGDTLTLSIEGEDVQLTKK